MADNYYVHPLDQDRLKREAYKDRQVQRLRKLEDDAKKSAEKAEQDTRKALAKAAEERKRTEDREAEQARIKAVQTDDQDLLNHMLGLGPKDLR